VECQRHEALLNLAFARGSAWRLLCPYDTSVLHPDDVEGARHTHRFLTDGRHHRESPAYRGDTWSGPTHGGLPEPPGTPPVLTFAVGSLEPVRTFVRDQAGAATGAPELSDFLLAVTEVAANSLRHGGGHGMVRVWTTDRAVVCEVRVRGWIRQPLVGRTRPALDQESGRGLWMVNQLCDLVQLRSSPAGTVVRMHMYRRR
jgi:anti-sigma regulatory factor (Ser/Thr protein kinase)